MFGFLTGAIGIGLLVTLWNSIKSFLLDIFGWFGHFLPWFAVMVIAFIIIRHYTKRSKS